MTKSKEDTEQLVTVGGNGMMKTMAAKKAKARK